VSVFLVGTITSSTGRWTAGLASKKNTVNGQNARKGLSTQQDDATSHSSHVAIEELETCANYNQV
jgi:hypothetical protein